MSDKLNAMQRPSTSKFVSQNKYDMFHKDMKSGVGESFVFSGNNSSATPGQNILTKPPSPSVLFSHVPIGSSRLTTMSSSDSGHLNVGLTVPQMGINIMERPITQHGVAGVRPGTGRGLPMTRQILDKRYYTGIMQLKIKELNQEIATIMKGIENQNKERATYTHYDNRAKDLATELTSLQGKLADYNIIVDKMTSDTGKEIIEQDIEELATKNEHSLLRIEYMFEKRKKLEQQLSRIEKQLDAEKKKTERLIEDMDLNTKEKYNELLNEKAILQERITKMQQELDKLSKEQMYLDDKTALSPLKQEVFKLHLKLIEAEEKRVKLQEEEKNRISPEEEKEKLLQKIKHDNVDIAAAEAQLVEKKKQMQEMEQEFEQLETDIEDTQSEKQVKYKEICKREEMMEQFLSSFKQNKQDETEKQQKLEKTVVEHLENISNMLDIDIDFTGSDEIAILKSMPPYNKYECVNSDQSFEGLTNENLKLQQIFSKMKILEQRIKAEYSELNEGMNKNENNLMLLGDLNNLKAKLNTKQKKLTAEFEQIKNQESKHKQELETTQLEYNEIKQRLENNEIFIEINRLENMVEKLIEEHTKIQDFITDQRERNNYGLVKEDVFKSINNYNTMIKENLKSIY